MAVAVAVADGDTVIVGGGAAHGVGAEVIRPAEATALCPGLSLEDPALVVRSGYWITDTVPGYPVDMPFAVLTDAAA